MASGEALKLIVAFGILLFLMRPISGLILDAFKVMLRLGLAGLVLLVLPLNFIDNWSKQAAGWTHITAVYVPVIALLGLIALSTANIVFLSGTRIEEIAKATAYTIGGVFTAGSADWLAWERSVGSVVVGVVGLFTNALTIIGHVLHP